ncbi:MAG TPA: SCP2 sterol-binding domain-containing protein, partial [Solirubrobacterales bacterium]|nr:SCP2 sterol-binding domain-containing protein [Solirubrobacterales bacterium]
ASQAGSGNISLHAQRVRRVEEAFRTLPSRYLGVAPDVDATFQVRLGDVGRTWQVRARRERCEVRPSPTREPDVVIGSDAATWIALREGRLSGLDAFAQRRLYARGDLDLALGFEGLFRLPAIALRCFA